MRETTWRNWALLPVLLAAVVWVPGALAGDADWVEINRWQGNGIRQTEPFWLLGESWVLKYKHSDGVSVDLYNLDGTKVGPVLESSSGIPGTAFRKEQGAHFLRISGAGTWEVVSQLFVLPGEKWQLSQMAGAARVPARRLAVWVGETGQDSFDVELPPGHWRVLLTQEGAGAVETVLKNSTGEVLFGTILRAPGKLEGWGYKPGRHTLKVHAEEAPWKLELFGE
ncbi:MAG: hypothetical protein WC708_18805 [Lentisphaeria bacterium]